MAKTFADFGLKFEIDKDCITCVRGTCHNNVTRYENSQEYNVQIVAYPEQGEYQIFATNLSDQSDEIAVSYEKEEDAVKFVCDEFNWFKCF